MFNTTKKSMQWGEETLTLETGKVARQADGSVIATLGETSVMANVTFAKEPKPGQVRVLLDFGGNTELLHLAESVTAAELWIAREGYRNARFEIVGAEEADRAGGADLAA